MKILLLTLLTLTLILISQTKVFASGKYFCDTTKGCVNTVDIGFDDLEQCVNNCKNDPRYQLAKNGVSSTFWNFKPAQNFTSISSVVSLAMSLITIGAGILTLYYFFYGAYKYMTAAGVAEEVAKAQKTITWSAIGLIFILLAYTVTNLILTASGFGKL